MKLRESLVLGSLLKFIKRVKMSNITGLFAVLIFMATGCTSTITLQQTQNDSVKSSIRALLDSYATNNQNAVIAVLDPEGFIIYGSDVSEKVEAIPALKKLIDDDFRLWKTASFGQIQDLSLCSDGVLAVAYFHVPFSAGGKPPIIVRFSMTWHRVKGIWKLRQSANTIPTVGMSAAGLIK
jgi:hypothetical protein